MSPSLGSWKNKQYRLPTTAAKTSFADFKKGDFFSFLLLSRVQQMLFKGGTSGLHKLETLVRLKLARISSARLLPDSFAL